MLYRSCVKSVSTSEAAEFATSTTTVKACSLRQSMGGGNESFKDVFISSIFFAPPRAKCMNEFVLSHCPSKIIDLCCFRCVTWPPLYGVVNWQVFLY